eukprot:TRINITY_DN9891_c0_g1_i1.p1 TRINITY_DN9891_c0_g1~~TRINITY_DN9891_c0_g1_i1.p1  ORF type:complete len:179 (+),score=54.24 TRINITY_DN9891_c0_g1_i1:64-600(+)
MYRSPEQSKNASKAFQFSPSRLDTMNFNAFMNDNDIPGFNSSVDLDNMTTSFNPSDFGFNDSDGMSALEERIADLEKENRKLRQDLNESEERARRERDQYDQYTKKMKYDFAKLKAYAQSQQQKLKDGAESSVIHLKAQIALKDIKINSLNGYLNNSNKRISDLNNIINQLRDDIENF